MYHYNGCARLLIILKDYFRRTHTGIAMGSGRFFGNSSTPCGITSSQDSSSSSRCLMSESDSFTRYSFGLTTPYLKHIPCAGLVLLEGHAIFHRFLDSVRTNCR